MLGPIAQRIGNLLARGSVAAADGARKMRTLQLRLLAGETKDAVEHFEPYGFSAEPHAGAEALAAFFDGDRSHGVCLVVADRRYRIRNMMAGEVAIFDDLGQKVHLTRN
ncbi:MAG: phage baseplate assembly protein, partial [Betaproteobacteria bacterium]|nr:phage baseplate assembly protein [Betaproteobacteria bacterium]